MLYSDPPNSGKMKHDTPFWIPEWEPYFITICCKKRGGNQLCYEDLAAALFGATKFYQDQRKWFCSLMLLMPDHVHAIIRFSPEVGMSRLIGDWKRYVSKMTEVEWQGNFFDHRLRGDDEVTRKDHYIMNNPVVLGLCDDESEWPWVFREQSR